MSAALAGAVSLVLEWRVFRAPYPAAGRALAAAFGRIEEAHNFDVVVPGVLYRSGLPDARFVRHLREERGVEHIVSLAGPADAHETARQLGMKVTVLDWPASHLPPRDELDALVAGFSDRGPILVHCAGGSDRTGYTVATWRVQREGWPFDQAIEEMDRYWHDSENAPRLHAELRAHLTEGADPPVAAGPPDPSR